MHVASAPNVSGFPSYISDNADKGRQGCLRSIFNKRFVSRITDSRYIYARRGAGSFALAHSKGGCRNNVERVA